MNEKTHSLSTGGGHLPAHFSMLGIESSCDETSAAVVQADGTIRSNVVLSQVEEHVAYGGVVPEIAARAHMEHMEQVVAAALSEAGTTLAEVDAIAVTQGPGLIGGVIVGVMAAKAYASVHRKPLVGVNHLEGHALTARLSQQITFPYLMLLVSGGHCQILVVEGVGRYHKLGATIDDALGEAFDKVAKMMGLPYPGGPEIEELALQGDAKRFSFPRPLLSKDKGGCNFSFSGLKTAVRQVLVEEDAKAQKAGQEGITPAMKADIAASFQATVLAILEDRLSSAIALFQEKYQTATPTLVLAGGVAANRYLRGGLEALVAKHQMVLAAPPIALCTDNAAMIAWAGIERLQAMEPPMDWDVLRQQNMLMEPRARWPLDEEREAA